MRNLILLFIVSIGLLMSCSRGDDVYDPCEYSDCEEETSDSSVNLESFRINLNGVDNIIRRDFIPPGESISDSTTSLSIMMASYDGGNMFTMDDGFVLEIEIPDTHKLKMMHKVMYSDDIALTFYIDATDDTLIATCIVNRVDQICAPELYEPRKLSNLGNSPYYVKIGDNINYLTDSEIVQENTVSGKNSLMSLSVFGGSISQISFNKNGDVMVDTGAEIRLSAGSDLIIPDMVITDGGEVFEHSEELFINEKKFFIPHKTGFFVQARDERGFYRLSGDNGILNTRYAQYKERYAYENEGGPNYTKINVSTGLSGCTAHIVGDDDIMICGDKIYLLGNYSTDMINKNLNYSGHTIFDLTIKAGNKLYFYSKNNNDGSENFFRLSKEDVVNEVSTTLLEDYKVIPDCFDVNKGDTDTLDIGAYRVIDNVQVILKITDANTMTPITTETIGECGQIVSF